MTANTSVGPPYQLNFAYDYQGRRIEKIVLIGGGPQSTNLFLYDGWNMVAELKPDNTLIRGYLWGTDLSGSPQGAGGVGGLVEMSYAGTNCFVAYDGNGNVAALVNAADGTVVANYEYGPFGELIRQTGPMAKANPIRFSTKYQDNESDLLYYGYRYYDPSMGKWLSSDRIEEGGGPDLYCAFGNDGINQFDVYGLWATAQHHALIDTWLQNNPPPSGETWSHYKWHCVYLDIPALLKQGNDVVDGVGEGFGAFCDAQSSENSYMHSMRAWYETKAVAKAKRDAFVRARGNLAEWYSNAARQDASAGCCGNDVQTYMDDAIILLGEAQHSLADDTSPPHHGFQLWFGIFDGIVILGPVGYAIFVERHHLRESPAVYASKGDGPANTVAAQMQPELLKILAQ
jgi:RHS repeat-associated protein